MFDEDRVIDECNATKYRSIDPGVCSKCEQCQSDYGMSQLEIEADPPDDEGGFSWHDCESCGSAYGGDRFAAHGWSDDDQLIHYEICGDCVHYLAYGIIPEEI